MRRAQVASNHTAPIEALQAKLGLGEFALVCLFVSPDADFAKLVGQANAAFAGTQVMACTTAGEIGQGGYLDDQIVAIAFPKSLFQVSCHLVENLTALDQDKHVDALIRMRVDLMESAASFAHEFAFMVVDGLSLSEDQLAAAIAPGLGPVPMFGGSAGDGTRFEQTLISLNGTIHRNAAIVALVRTRCPIKVFSLDHLTPKDVRMVVTKADPSRRIVERLNAEPAAAEYARILGKDPQQLDNFTFAASPVVVRLGGTHHVRAIQRVTPDGDLVFFSAIDEGMVLTLAEPEDIVSHLSQAFHDLLADKKPDAIIAFDCFLRRIEATQKQVGHQLGKILDENRVVGFSTYGEQRGALHVNHTMTGVAIFTPEDTE
nr:FIST N-terminal domain-containing protein [Pseudaestuariivita rosea]